MTVESVLVLGASGSIGSRVVAEAASRGLQVRALVRSQAKAGHIPDGATAVIGDVTDVDSLRTAATGVDGVISCLGGNPPREVDYGGVLNLLEAVGEASPRLVLMTSINVTDANSGYDLLNWKRRSEYLARVSGLEVTIVRPSWFDAQQGEHLRFSQGDTVGGGIARAQLARVLVDALLTPEAVGKTFELSAVAGPATEDTRPMFAELRPDAPGEIHGIKDRAVPATADPQAVHDDVARIANR